MSTNEREQFPGPCTPQCDASDVGITLSLLDSSKGHAIQTWKFGSQSVIRIGRSGQNDVAVGDPVVSRTHAELKFSEGRWRVASLGRFGTLVDGTTITGETSLNHKSVFQLGPNGPSFEFRLGQEAASATALVTNLEGLQAPEFALDGDKRQAEVSRITESDVFRKLKQQAEEMKRNTQTR